QLKNLDGKVLQLLKDYRWFHFIGVGPGWENIANLKDVFFLNYFSTEKYTISKSYFHILYGKVLRLTGIRDPLTAFYFLRWLSFLMYITICFLCYFFYKKYFPDHGYYLMAGQLLIYQVGNILNSLNYDVLLTFLGVLFFIFAYRFMMTDEKKGLAIVLLLVIAAVASLVKTGGVLFFLYFFILLLFKYGFNRKMLKWLLLGTLLFAVIFSWFNYWFPGRFFKLYGVIFLKLRALGGGVTRAGTGLGGDNGTAANIGFFDSIVDSFYFYTGWMGFRVPGAWYWVLKSFLLAAVTGLIVMLSRKKTTADPAGIVFSPGKRWLMYGSVLLVVQLLAVRFYYGSGLMSQGRYLYPLLIPIIMLIYSGLNSLEVFLKFKRNYLLFSYLLFLVLFFVMALSRVITVFYLEIASPHVGL
ncbi:MAG TPA: hypothetical protein VK469_07710, partial [Candidatus Kapabacteria bacterium]|nr:hypothetical protein [Candidatus Kapabacteria bacterium]